MLIDTLYLKHSNPNTRHTGINKEMNVNEDRTSSEIDNDSHSRTTDNGIVVFEKDFQKRRRQRLIKKRVDLIQSNNRFWHKHDRGSLEGVLNEGLYSNIKEMYKPYSDNKLLEILKDISILNDSEICLKSLYQTIRNTMLIPEKRNIMMKEYRSSLNMIATKFILNEINEPVEYGFIIKIALLEDEEEAKISEFNLEEQILKSAFVVIKTRMRMTYSGSLLKTALYYIKIVIFDKLMPIENKSKEINDIIFNALQMIRDLGNYTLETNQTLYGKSRYNLEKNLIALADWEKPSYERIKILREDATCQRYKYLYHDIKDYTEIPIGNILDYYDMDDRNKYTANILYIDECLQNGRKLENRYKESEGKECEEKLQESYLAITIMIDGYKNYFDYMYNIFSLQYLYEILKCNSANLRYLQLIIIDLFSYWLDNKEMHAKFNAHDIVSVLLCPIMEFGDVSCIRSRKNNSEYLYGALSHASYIMNELLDSWSVIYFLFEKDNIMGRRSITCVRIQQLVDKFIDTSIYFHEGIPFITSFVQKIVGMEDRKLDFSTWEEAHNFFISYLQPDKFDASLGNAFVVAEGVNIKLLKDIKTGKYNEVSVSKLFFYYRFNILINNGMLDWIITTSIVNYDDPETYKSVLLLFRCLQIQEIIYPKQYKLDSESIQLLIDRHTKDIIKVASGENANYKYIFSRSVRYNAYVLSKRLNELLESYRPSLLYYNCLSNLKHFVIIGRKVMATYCDEDEDIININNIERILSESNKSIAKINSQRSKKNVDTVEMDPIIKYLEYTSNNGTFRNYLAENPLLRFKLIEWLQLALPQNEFFLATYPVKNKIPIEIYNKKKENIVKLFKMTICYTKIYPDLKDFFLAYINFFIDKFEINSDVSNCLTINNLTYQQGYNYFGFLSYIFGTDDERFYDSIKKLMLKFIKLIKQDKTGIVTQLIISIMNYEGPHSVLSFSILETVIINDKKKTGLWCLNFLNLFLDLSDDNKVIEKVFLVLSSVMLEVKKECALRILEIIVTHRQKIQNYNQLVNIHHINNVEKLDYYNLFAKYVLYSSESYFLKHMEEAQKDLNEFIDLHFQKLLQYVKDLINNELDSRYKRNSKGKFERTHFNKRTNKSSTIPSTIIDMFASHEIGTQFIIQHDIFSKFYKPIAGEYAHSQNNIIESSILFIAIYMKNISEEDHIKYDNERLNDYKNAIKKLKSIWMTSNIIHLRSLALYALNLVPHLMDLYCVDGVFKNTLLLKDKHEDDLLNKNDSGYMDTTDLSYRGKFDVFQFNHLSNYLNLDTTECPLYCLILPNNNYY
uniref:Formin 2 n=1 Tax=Parastrongyloides trichosuri TaxID=131310 RepID=A0A0N5A309_PARTI